MKCNNLMRALLGKGGENSIGDFLATERRIEKLFKSLKIENGGEISINAQFPKKEITPAFAAQFFAQFNARLQEEYDGKLRAEMTAEDGRWTYRFRVVGEGEPPLSSEDLEKLPLPIMCEIFGE